MAAPRDDRLAAEVAQGRAEAVGVIGTVGDQAAERARVGDEFGRGADVGAVAGGEA